MYCKDCPDPMNPDPFHHPKGQMEHYVMPEEGLSIEQAHEIYGDDSPFGNPTHPDAKWGLPTFHNTVYKTPRF